jgi:hypothetical protein
MWDVHKYMYFLFEPIHSREKLVTWQQKPDQIRGSGNSERFLEFEGEI